MSESAVDQIRKTVEARLAELRPVSDELERLREILRLIDRDEADLAALDLPAGVPGAVAAAAPARGPIRRARSGSKVGSDGRAPQGANRRAIIEAVRRDPGITPTEISERTGVKRTVVSSTVNRLKHAGDLEPFGVGVRVRPESG
jgi:hypothetical protein